MNPIYGLIFDVDGVIADTEGVNARATIRVFAELLGITGVVREDFSAGIGRGAEEYVKAAARVHGVELTDEQVDAATRLRQRYFLDILKNEPLGAFPGVLPLMADALNRKDFRVGIATSGTRAKSQAVLRSAGVAYERMVYVTGDAVSRKKPDPELFVTAAEQMGVDPTRCVVIEDAPNGVEAAKRAGARCLAVTNTAGPKELAQADVICETLDEIDLGRIIKMIDAR